MAISLNWVKNGCLEGTTATFSMQSFQTFCKLRAVLIGTSLEEDAEVNGVYFAIIIEVTL